MSKYKENLWSLNTVSFLQPLYTESYIFCSLLIQPPNTSSDFPMRWMGLVTSHWASMLTAAAAGEVGVCVGVGGVKLSLYQWACLSEKTTRLVMTRLTDQPRRKSISAFTFLPIFKPDVRPRLFQSTSLCAPPGSWDDLDRSSPRDRRLIRWLRWGHDSGLAGWKDIANVSYAQFRVIGWKGKKGDVCRHCAVFISQMTTVMMSHIVVSNLFVF